MSDHSQKIRKRRVFYIPGYDPFPPRRYRELYRKEGTAQAEVSGYQLRLTASSDDRLFGWHVDAEIDGQGCSSEISVLTWSDIVRESMEKGVFATYLLMLRTAWIYIGSGALFRLMRLRKGPVIAALYPVLFLTGQLAIAILIAWGLSDLLGRLLPPHFAWISWAALAVIPVVLHWFKRHDNKIFAYYLMHDYAYSAATNGSNSQELDERIDAFKTLISQALQSDVDEVLVVGHSSGAHLAVSVLARLLREGRPATAAQLSFLSLGQVVPMVSFLPQAQDLRRDLKQMAAQDQVFWLDVTAPGDGCAFALCDPVAVTGVAPKKQNHPLILSAAFTQTLSEERWKALRWRFFRLHFQYLCAFDRPDHYDYFKITAGPESLSDRFKDKTHSPSRIISPVNKFTDIAP